MIKRFICKVFNLVPKTELELITKELDKLKEENQELRNNLSVLQKNATMMKSNISNLQEQNTALENEKKALEGKLAQANKQISELTLSNDILSHRIKDLEKAISDERSIVQSKEISIESLKSENDSLREDVEKLEALLKQAEENLKEKELEYGNSIERIEKEHYKLYQENLNNINARNSMEETLKRQKGALESEQNLKAELTLLNEAQKLQIKNLQNKCDKYKGQIIYYSEQEERQLKEHTSIVQQLQQELIENKKVIEEKTAIIESQDAELTNLNKNKEELLIENGNLKASVNHHESMARRIERSRLEEMEEINLAIDNYKRTIKSNQDELESLKKEIIKLNSDTYAASASSKNNNDTLSNVTKNSDNTTYRSIYTKDYNTKHKHLSLTNKIDFKKLIRDGRYNDKKTKSKVYTIDAKIRFIIEQLAKLNLKVKFDGNSFWYEKKDRTGKRELPYNTMEIYNDSIIVLYGNKFSEGFDLNTGKRVSSYSKKDDLLKDLDNYFEEEYINKV